MVRFHVALKITNLDDLLLLLYGVAVIYESFDL